MPRLAEKHVSVSGGMVIAGMALAIICVIVLILCRADRKSADTGASVISVVPGAAPLAKIDNIGEDNSNMLVQSGIQTMPNPATDDIAVSETEMANSHRDQRTVRDEVSLSEIVKTTLPGLRSPIIVCAGVTCRISGGLPTAAGSTRAYFRSVEFSDAIFALGYSPGPDRFEAQGADTTALLYLKRDN